MKQKIYRKTILCVSVAIVISFLATARVTAKKEAMIEELSREVFRFHVLANSDSDEDQALKMKVKEAVISYMKTSLGEKGNVDLTKRWAREHLGEIETVARKIIEMEGYAYPVEAEVTTCDFPEKVYGDITFPAGRYEALRVKIGQAEGQNWWCVLYPNLCFVDAIRAVVPHESKQELKQVLEEDTYDMITNTPRFRIRWFFFS